MITIATILFWIGIFTLIYHYTIYPVLLTLLSKGKTNGNIIFNKEELPNISILLAAYNEVSVIEEKIKSTFNSTYPIDKIEFIIGSDSSNDGTDDVIKNYQSKYPQLKLKHFSGRTGKPQIINQLEKIASHSILVLTDANVFFEKTCLFELVKHFKNESIGLVGGNILNIETKADGISNQEKAYLSQENITKYHEGILWGCMMGAFGGLFAVRRSAYKPVPKRYLVDDFYISMNVLIQKFKAINSLEAIGYEDVSNSPKEEFRRKVRIGVGNFQNLFAFKSLIFSRFGVSFSFISHKVIRWKGPFILILLITCLPFLFPLHTVYQAISIAFLLLFISPFIDKLLKSLNIHLKTLRFASHFVMMNLALLIGFFKFAFGLYGDTWTPTKRNQ